MIRRAAVAIAVLAGVWIAPPVARTALNVSYGLTAQSFTNLDRSGTRSFGYITLLRGGRYRFELRSSAPSVLEVAGSRAPEAILAAGAHFILIETTHDGISPPVELLWARDGAALSAVPSWRLSPSRIDTWRLLVVRTLEWLRGGATIVGAIAAAAIAFSRWRLPLTAAARAHPQAAAFVLFMLMTLVQTWPLATNPARLSRHDNSDAMLNEWALGWVAHQVLGDPLHLFDANIFFPERNTLAYSEAMLLQGIAGAPLLWAGASTLFVHNVMVLAGFTLTGWATSIVAARWTGSWVAGAAAGIVAAFNAHTLTRLPHLQALHVEFLPLALAAFDSLLREPRVGHAVRLAGWFALQSLASLYLLVFSVFALFAAAIARPREWLGSRFRQVAVHVALAAAIGVALLVPYLQAYWQVHSEQGMIRPLSDVEFFMASWTDYLSSPSRIHFNTWSHRVFSGAALFPGFMAIVLAANAIGRGIAWSDPRARMCLAFGLCGLVLSFGTKIPGYALLYDALPLLKAVRAVSRFGYLALLAVAFLAAFGIADLRQRLPGRWWPAAAVAILAIVALEPLVAPIHFSRSSEVPAIYELVASEPNAVVAELPMPGGRAWFGNARYMLNSTKHWKKMINGYSGFAPRSFHEHGAALAQFPAPPSIAALQAIGVTHAFVHIDGFTAEQRAVLDTLPDLVRLAEADRTILYRVKRRPGS
jgi:hypothetical protein